MTNIIHLPDRQHDWFSGWVRCASCDYRHVCVQPMPRWAEGPATSECPKCGEMSCLPERDHLQESDDA